MMNIMSLQVMSGMKMSDGMSEDAKTIMKSGMAEKHQMMMNRMDMMQAMMQIYSPVHS